MFVLDDQEIVRRGVRGLLEAEPDIRVVGEAGTARPRWPGFRRCAPMWRCWMSGCPMGTGCQCAGRSGRGLPGVACLMFTAFSDDQALLGSIMAGAAGYVLKQVRGSDLVGAVRVAASGRSLLATRAASQVMPRLQDASSKRGALARLTPHERSVLELIGEGLTNRQIGERLFIAEKTVKNYVSTLFRKLGLEQRTAAAAYAARTFNGRKVESGQNMWIIDRNPGT